MRVRLTNITKKIKKKKTRMKKIEQNTTAFCFLIYNNLHTNIHEQ